MHHPVRVRVAAWLMRQSHARGIFGPPPVLNTRRFVEPKADGVSPATRRELADGPSFFERFEGQLHVGDLAASDVLDLGSGYGGRAIYCALHGAPLSVVGLEIVSKKIDFARSSAATLCPDSQPTFTLGWGEDLPFEDACFDTILSYDVFEHVRDLPRVLRECYRVLRPGGRVCALFPPYFGPRAHHLDFITTMPFLHYVFSADVLVRAANEIVRERPEIGRPPLPPPRSSDGRMTLPSLNGTTEREFRAIVAAMPFEIVELSLLPFGWGPGGRARTAVRSLCRAMIGFPWPFSRDPFVTSIRCILRKPGDGPRLDG
jgi:SAM-dependent methyltransferase